MDAPGTTWKKGGCHCGAVTFEVLAPDEVEVIDCSCSMCSKTGYLHLMVPKERFRLLSGADKLTTYQFNTKVAKHLFCSVCGIKSFYVPRSHPDGYSVNFRCLTSADFRGVRIEPFDGVHWEQHAAELKPLETN
ncbi:MAG: GFA family protein [Alphaproteobacteria bacterium]|nr:GFA family protein [Alphaproteobacteria bacterium]